MTIKYPEKDYIREDLIEEGPELNERDVYKSKRRDRINNKKIKDKRKE